MRLLALETATEACSAAVLADGAVLGHRFELAPRRQAELILPMCEAALVEAGLRLKDLDALAFGRGPGAFTGVRIAASVAQGIAYAAGLPVLPVSTLAALAHSACRVHGVDRVAAAIDARMGEVYWGCYVADPDEGFDPVVDDQVRGPEAVAAPRAAGDWYGAGTGWDRHGEALRRRLPIADCWPRCYPDACDVALLAAPAWQRGEAVSPEQALPVYLRDRVTHDAPTAMPKE